MTTELKPYRKPQEHPSVTGPEALAEAKLGLYFPVDLSAALGEIAKANRLGEWPQEDPNLSPEHVAAYFIGHAINSNLQRLIPSPSKPFMGVEILSLPEDQTGTDQPQNVLLLGSSSEGSYLLEQVALNKIGVSVRNHTTIDFSLLPLRRIKHTVPEASLVEKRNFNERNFYTTKQPQKNVLLHGDASTIALPDGSQDIVMTDLFFGSTTDETEKNVLNNVARMTRNGGQLLMKASALSPLLVEQMKAAGHGVGEWWEGFAKIFSDTPKDNLRDGYLGLTPEQWKTLGIMYTDFVSSRYFGNNRFTDPEQIKKFVEGTGDFKVREIFNVTKRQNGYFAIRAEKI